MCRFCGAQLASATDQCPACGQTQSAAVEFAGLGRRFLGYVLDQAVIFGGFIGVFGIVGAFLGFAAASSGDTKLVPKFIAGMQNSTGQLALQLSYIVLSWIYYARMESSPGQATLGKRWLKMRVVDTEGGRLSFGRATKRYFSKILSAIAFGAGFIMIAFSDRKQGLHDRIADTLVVRR